MKSGSTPTRTGTTRASTAARLDAGDERALAAPPRELEAPAGAQLRGHADDVAEADEQHAVQQRLQRQQPRALRHPHADAHIRHRDDDHRKPGGGGARQRQPMRVAAPHRGQREVEPGPCCRISEEQHVGKPPTEPSAAADGRRRQRPRATADAARSTDRRRPRPETSRREPARRARASAGKCPRRSP